MNLVDNATDMTHVGRLHRTCALFGDQKMGGGVAWESLGGRGIRAKLGDMGGHDGNHAIDGIEWYMPGMVFHGRKFMGGVLHGLWFWWVPRAVVSRLQNTHAIQPVYAGSQLFQFKGYFCIWPDLFVNERGEAGKNRSG